MDKQNANVRPATKNSVALRVAKDQSRTEISKTPDKFTYALAAYTAERRANGWYVTKTTPSCTGDKPKWSGPFQSIEHACLSIGRHCAVELADRHTRSIESYGIARSDGLFGLKPTTRIRSR